MFHMREYYVLKYKSHDPDNPMYMEALSGKNAEEYFKAMDDESQRLMRKEKWVMFQGSQFLITMCFHEHGLSSVRGNLIGR